jgi:microcystin degradation protein MlrC
MRIATGNIGHESNSFTPIPTPYEAFSEQGRGIYRGEEVLTAMRGKNTGCGGFIDGTEAHGLELVPLLWTFAQPSGPVEATAYRRLKDEFLERLRAAMPVDGALLDLHGAMVVEDIEDGEGDLLAAVREILGPDRPILVTLDLHCNITQQMVDCADVLIPCDENPHTDLAERGREAADLIVRMLRDGLRPSMAWRQLPMFWGGHQLSQHEPYKSVLDRVHAMEQQTGILTASVAPGFAWADIHDAGSSVVVVTDHDPERAQREADALGEWVFSRRAEWQLQLLDFPEALRQGRASGAYPVILADGQDNPGGGAPGDSTGMLRAFLEADLDEAAILAVWDPEAVQTAIAAGIGNEVTLTVGGKSSPLQGLPVSMTARVIRISDGRYVNQGPMFTGVEENTGPTVVLQQGGVRVAVISRRTQVLDAEFPRSLGIEPTRLKWIGLKSSNHFRASYEPSAGAIYRVAFPSVQPYDLTQLPYRRRRRPMYPLEAI